MGYKYSHSAVIGIIYTALLGPYTVLSFMQGAGSSLFVPVISLVLGAVLLVIYAFYEYGFYSLSIATGNKGLRNAVVISILVEVFFLIVECVMLVLNAASSYVIGIITIISILLFTGLAQLYYGISALKLKTLFGSLGEAYGVLTIIAGASMLSIIFAPIALLLMLPIQIVSIVILFKSEETVKRING